MKRAHVAAILLSLLVSVPAVAQFRDVAHRIEASSGMSRVHVPGLWLARLATRAADPEGAHDIRLAIFDSSSARQPFDAAAIMRSSLGPEWQPIVRFTDHRSGEQGVIYARPSGSKEISLMMFVIDDEDSVLTELRIDADRLSSFVEESSGGDAQVE
jgi:hypothetical protein